MDIQKIIKAEEKLYTSSIKNIDQNLKSLIRIQKEVYLAQKIDDELER